MEIAEFVEQLQAWHSNKVAQLRQITENEDAVIQIGEMEIEPDSDAAKWFRAGVAISLEMLGKLPFSVSRKEGDELEEGYIKANEGLAAGCEDFVTDCCNPECGWFGLASECVSPKHSPDVLLCPKCYEVTEPADNS